MDSKLEPKEIVQLMMDEDLFSQWLKIQIVEVKEGHVKIKMKVTKSMVNGFGIAHGGIMYSFADSALAFASNSYGYQAVSFDSSIKHLRSVVVGTELLAETELIHKSRSLCHMQVRITSVEDGLLALFMGTCKISSKLWSRKH